jgi:2-keto-4-pentenoate hydratase/2-oxohepta-3-ene-1,7-dioic acid hydratase in catechol pathway
MKLIRYQTAAGIFHGEVDGDHIHRFTGNFFTGPTRTSDRDTLSSARLMHPTVPTKIVNLAVNYASHAGGRPLNLRPQPFLAAPSSALDPEAAIILPADSVNAHYEGEVAIVIGRRASHISAADARGHVLGVCCANDVSERAWQGGDDKDTQWWRAKSADTFSPFGPVIVTNLDYDDLDLETRLNGKTVQQGNTSQLVFPIDECIAYISQYMTLEPGDLIFTGTPGTTGPLNNGDIVEIEVQGVGVLRNPVEHL